MIRVTHNNELYHVVVRASDFELGRFDVIPETNFLQLAALALTNGQTFRAHKHLYKDGPEQIIAQESWVVIKGKVKAIFYGDDNRILKEVFLYPGDASVTLKGGHNYESMEPGTLVYEFKTGPYTGQTNDKTFI